MNRSLKGSLWQGKNNSKLCRVLGVVMGNCCKGLPIEEIKMFFPWGSLLSTVLWIFPESSVGRWDVSPVRLHCDFHFMVSVILELGGEKLTLKDSCAGDQWETNSEMLMFRVQQWAGFALRLSVDVHICCTITLLI